MKNFQTTIPLLTVAAIASSFSFISTLKITASAPYIKVETVQPAYGKPRGGAIGRNLSNFLGEYVVSPFFSEAGSTIASEVVNRAFNPKRETVSATTNINRNIYLGSTFIEPNLQYLFFANSEGGWFIYNYQYQIWEPSYPPNFRVYRTADIFQDSRGLITANRFW
ncbi:hypothetical protein [Nostoc sp. FACHB-190]|uniref:hypothetical protein n=1 Tax=Nostoc sp. FACHB-190 TaxID=2692838 RepID=UPI00168709DC|nr:hypothetical protein [Nostoc sp. FACHB-190]MBD2299068.1 hypothetical protein [Nostoc sp. FACHB-190]